ncbi:uncharacterized protein LOC108319219 isoform X2 [Vigna angularis]|uniref:uncharacterized protein LOC108319219 isoform X2 n=1 Tax=Phaseolus angularis TaxID=3914 RepID=UPI0022B42483|nr:uncharacterized protein LOC108319219 isoform X2 [Vigna angularis]XP_052725183.1 uncharacterized protein LOC108319219 isoform X2 [Vigna angularis]
MWAMEHVLFGQKKLAKRKSCLPRILHWIHVKMITEVYVTKEEMATEIVKEALDDHHNTRVKQNYGRKSLADIVAENEALRAIIGDQEASIVELEKLIEKLQMFAAQKRQQSADVGNCYSNKDYDIVVDGFGTTNSEEDYEVFDITPDAGGKSVHEESGDVLGDEEMDIEKSNMSTRLKAQPRKRVKSLALKTTWTKLDRKNARH